MTRSLFIVAIALRAWAADVTFTITPPLIALGESAEVIVEIHGGKSVKAPTFPTVSGLRFAGTGRSSKTQISNGHIDRSITFTTRVYPQRTGDFKVGPFSYSLDGKNHMLEAPLKVVSTTQAAQSETLEDMIFAKLSSSVSETYVQEPFELSLSIYSRVGIQLGRQVSIQGMPSSGLSELNWTGANATREKVNGQIYDVQKYTTPIRSLGSGKFNFEPTIIIQVATSQQRQRNDPFGSFFNRQSTQPLELALDPVAVNVKPLPNRAKPAGFTGAVGRFQFQVTADPVDVKPGDPITLSLTVVGEGNYDRIQPPALPDDAPFRLFGDAVRQQGNNGVRFEQVVSPRDATVTEIPVMEFAYFDTKSGQYRTIKSRAIPITVTESENSEAQLFVSQQTLAAPEINQPFASESDVQYALSWIKKVWKGIRAWLWVIPTVLGIGLIVFLGQKLYHWHHKDVARVRRQKAPKAARKALAAATEARAQGDSAAFYNALWSALADYFGHRLNLAPGEISTPLILQALQNGSLDDELIQQTSDLCEKIDAIRYCPQTDKLNAHESEQHQALLANLLKQADKKSVQR